MGWRKGDWGERGCCGMFVNFYDFIFAFVMGVIEFLNYC